jgi:hypothetical protein
MLHWFILGRCAQYLLCKRRVVQHVPLGFKGRLGGCKPAGLLGGLDGVVMVQDLVVIGRAFDV